jgi:hypothetical protein
MSYLTFNDLSTRSFIKAETFNESISGKTIPTKKVFLSYRHQDRNWVSSVVQFLKTLGVSVYVDYLDQTLEEQSNEQVASTLRKRIGDCSKFISLATPNSSGSKWMPWELGLGDRIVNYPHVAVLPLTNNHNYWPDQEYGKIYGRIENIPSYGFPKQETWYIIFPDQRKINFKKWLSN